MTAKTKTATRIADHGFRYRDGVLHADGVDLADIAAQFGTPGYVYSRRGIVDAYRRYDTAFGAARHLVCFAVKANPANAILSIMAELKAGFDIVSGGELSRALQAGADPARIIFAGVGKMDSEFELALDAGIRSFNIESQSELRRLDFLAGRKNLVAPVALRINPDVAADTHPHISTGGSEHKFGIPMSQARGLVSAAKSLDNVVLRGLAMHIGSQMMSLQPVIEAARSLRRLADELRTDGVVIEHLDLGGGLGVGSDAPSIENYVQALCGVFADTDDYELVIEPGRSLVASAGVLLTTVLYIKHSETKSFAVVDSGMNDLLRPALYGAHHDIVAVDLNDPPPVSTYEIVGPVCETADSLGRHRRMALREGSVLAIVDTGAYCATMSSHYNSRPRCSEVMIEDGVARLSRQRESIAELSRNEKFMTQKIQ